jgi:hypothetical protein
MEEARQRFERFLQPQDNGCINFTGGKVHNGYGQFGVDGKTYRAHRFAWLLAGNIIPDGLMLRHKCKQSRACCNVEHLELGTAQDNANDRLRDATLTIGEKVHTCKLTAEQVLEIRARANERRQDLADEFGVSYVTISHLIYRLNWKHI